MFPKNYYLQWIAGRANILSKYLIYIFFNFVGGFCGSFSILFTETSASCDKNFWNKFCCIVLLFAWAQKAFLRFLKSYLKLEILIFLSLVVSFWKICLTKKVLFWRKNYQRWNLRHTLIKKLSKFDVAMY